MSPAAYLQHRLFAVLGFTLLCLPPVGTSAAEPNTTQAYRSIEIPLAAGRMTGFKLLGAETAVSFTNLLSEQRHLTNQILLNGSGVAAGDVDGDGLADLYFCGLDSPNALYKNLGNWKFQEIAATAGVACRDLLATASALADLDGDSDLDLIVNSIGQGTHLFFNDGRGRFTKSPAVLNQQNGGMSLALGDLGGDGYLDLYVANYRTLGLMDIPNARATFKTLNGKSYVETFNGRPTTSPELTNRFSVGPRGGIEEHGEPDLVARNLSGTNFTPLASSSFLDAAGHPLGSEYFDWGLAVAIRDINGDTLPDIYVCNDFHSEDRLWLNQGNGNFRLAPPWTLRHSSMFSMAVDFADINRDGLDDFLIADMRSRDHSQRMRDLPDAPPIYNIGEIDNRPQYNLNTLFLNRGDQTFAEVARLARLDSSEWTWSCIFIDIDLDGWEDVLFSNGMERAARDLDIAERLRRLRATRRMSDAEIFQARKMFPRLAPANLAFRNNRDLTFSDTSAEWGFNLPGVSHGMALADLDNDGDLDIAVNNLNASAAIYRNESTAPRVAVRLKGKAPNTHGIGARVTVRAEGLPPQSQEMMSGGRYLSSDDPIRTFAVGGASTVDIEVRWRDGTVTTLTALSPNRIYEIDQSSATRSTSTPSAPKPPFFEDISASLKHTAPEEPYDDFARQPLLPRKLSQNGSPAAWLDWNGDGWEDLVIGAPKSGSLVLYQNAKDATFSRIQTPSFNAPTRRDIPALAAARFGLQPILFAAASNYEDGFAHNPGILGYYPGKNAPSEILPAWDSSAGPLALADIDLDGDLDVFVGGSVIPGRYPAPASSRFLRNESGRFSVDQTNEKALANLGLVNGAAFADIDSDADPDLILASEWSPIRIFINTKGAFADATGQFGFAAFKGFWQGIAVGDFDADGRLDFAASNWGRNSKYQNPTNAPARLYAGDFDEDGTFDVIEAQYDAALGKYVPDRQRDVIGAAIPSVIHRFRTHIAYSKAGVDEILGEARARAQIFEANWFDSTVFINRGDHFAPHPLPIEAQFAPAFGICVADFNNDSREDIVLAQNFFAVTSETPRHDAGRALLLSGTGNGEFRSVSGHESGILIYGEQRSAASADFDHDGRADLVITENGIGARLLRNRGASPGIRVILKGPASNLDAIGASMRMLTAQTPGPRRLVSAGSGFGSQNAPVQILPTPTSASILEVVWPDGTKSSANISPEQSEIIVPYPEK